ncbi:MAG TPA: filamentous hemagglutinin N-terminal domain-containing protein, partial [Candidatus Binatia bacterium]
MIRALVVASFAQQPGIGLAQVATTITSSGLGTTVTQTGTTHNITGGTRPGNGANLFHSFGLFNVGEGHSANFLNNTGLATSNILGRVTGGQRSSIFGTIQTTNFGAANLFLVNPAGWIFGPTASLNVGGAFHVSTADYIRLSDGVLFNATPGPADPLLTSAPPAAFGFLGSPLCVSPCITVDGGFLGGTLQVPEGQTLSLVGGDVTITGAATLFAPSGRVQIASVASGGEVTISDLNVSALSQLGKIDISGSFINVSGDFSGDGAGGTVVIRGGQLFVDSSTITSETIGNLDGASTGVDIQMVDRVEFTNGTSITTATSGTGRGGNIEVKAASLSMGSGGTILSQTFGDGQGGNVSLTTDGAAEISGSSISSASFGTGLPGDISVNVGALTLTDASTIQAGLFSGTEGANVTVTARDSIVISNGSGISSQSFLSNVGQVAISAPTASLTIDNGFISTGTLETGNAGDISIDVQSLTLTGGGQIASSNVFQATGSGGDVTINANSVSISGTSPTGVSVLPSPFGDFVNNPNSGIFSAAFSESPLAGPGGTITVSTPTLTMTAGGTISVATVGGGDAGNVALNVGDLTLASSARIDSSTTAAGAGGNLNIAAETVNIGGAGSGLFSTASSTGNAGQINLATPTLTMADGGKISVETSGGGSAGSISVNASNLTQTGGAQVVSSTTGDGAGGMLAVTASELVSISGAGSGLLSTASSTGNAGQIN